MASILEQLPAYFWDVPYDGSRIPTAGTGLASGANCQHFAYELLRHFGRQVEDLRSSELWESTASLRVEAPFEPLDLLLFSPGEETYGAHVAVYTGDGAAIHLSKRVGKPAMWRIEQFLELPEYRVLIGGKRYPA
jgi:cell wall-associated NlpC family hydrolase